jgi:glycerol-3-phosphate dehydrogenase subunit B
VRPGASGDALEIAIGDSEPTDPSAVASGRTTRYQATVMATGRFVGGGLCEGENGLEEPILGLALHDARGRRADGESAQFLSNPDYEAPQPLYSAGVKVDRQLRPLDGAGRPAALHLYAAGELIGGFDPALDRSGYGVALLSGMRAGAEALHAALDPS